MKLYEESHSGWTIRNDGTGHTQIVDANGWTLATLNYDFRFTCNATNHHRANLFAAAPETLAALQELLKWWNEDDMDHEVYAAAEKQALAAVAKALGRNSDDRVPDGDGGIGA